MGLFNLVARMSLNDRNFQAGMKRVESAAIKTGRRISSNFKGAVGGAVVGAFSVGAVKRAVTDAVNFGSKLTDLAAQTGLSVEQLQAFERAAVQTGTSLDNVAARFTNLARRGTDAFGGRSERWLASFTRLGITADDFANKKPAEIFLQIADAVKNSENNLGLLQDATRLFGLQGAEMTRAFIKDFSGLARESLKTSNKLTSEMAEDLTILGDKWASLTVTIKTSIAQFVLFSQDMFSSLYDGLRVDIVKIKTLLTTLHPEKASQAGEKLETDIALQRFAEREMMLAAIKKRLSQPLSDAGLDPEDFGKQGGVLSVRRASVDSLQRIGGFAAIGSKSENRDRLVKMNQLLEKISRSTKETADNTKEDAI